jgi:hypothetical protein
MPLRREGCWAMSVSVGIERGYALVEMLFGQWYHTRVVTANCVEWRLAFARCAGALPGQDEKEKV